MNAKQPDTYTMNPITLDSYECRNCAAWSHYEQCLDDEQGAPEYCPYCGHESLMWRTDTNYKLIEVTP